MPTDFDGLPAADLVTRGIEDAREGIPSIPALLVSIAPTRLRSLGVDVKVLSTEPEHALYERLCADNVSDPYARYNSLVRELDSFMEALSMRTNRVRNHRA